MLSREPRYRDTLSRATPWTCGPSSLDTSSHPILADPGLSLIAASASDKVQGRVSRANNTMRGSSSGLIRGSVASGSASAPDLRLQQRARPSGLRPPPGGGSACCSDLRLLEPGHSLPPSASGGVMRTSARRLLAGVAASMEAMEVAGIAPEQPSPPRLAAPRPPTAPDVPGSASGHRPPDSHASSPAGHFNSPAGHGSPPNAHTNTPANMEHGALARPTHDQSGGGGEGGEGGEGGGGVVDEMVLQMAPQQLGDFPPAYASACAGAAAGASAGGSGSGSRGGGRGGEKLRGSGSREGVCAAEDDGTSNPRGWSAASGMSATESQRRDSSSGRGVGGRPTVSRGAAPSTASAKLVPSSADGSLSDAAKIVPQPSRRRTPRAHAAHGGGASAGSATAGGVALPWASPNSPPRFPGSPPRTPTALDAFAGESPSLMPPLRSGGESMQPHQHLPLPADELLRGHTPTAIRPAIPTVGLKELMPPPPQRGRPKQPLPPREPSYQPAHLPPSTISSRVHLAPPPAAPAAGGAASDGAMVTGVGYGDGYGGTKRGMLPLPLAHQPATAHVLAASAEPRGSQLLPLRVVGTLMCPPYEGDGWSYFEWEVGGAAGGHGSAGDWRRAARERYDAAASGSGGDGDGDANAAEATSLSCTDAAPMRQGPPREIVVGGVGACDTNAHASQPLQNPPNTPRRERLLRDGALLSPRDSAGLAPPAGAHEEPAPAPAPATEAAAAEATAPAAAAPAPAAPSSAAVEGSATTHLSAQLPAAGWGDGTAVAIAEAAADAAAAVASCQEDEGTASAGGEATSAGKVQHHAHIPAPIKHAAGARSGAGDGSGSASLASVGGRELVRRIHEVAMALTDKEYVLPATLALSAAGAAGAESLPVLAHAAGKPAGALALELTEPAAEAALRAALPALVKVAEADGDGATALPLVRYLLPLVVELRSRLAAARHALRQLHASLPPPPTGATPLGAVSVGRALIAMAEEGSEHPGAAAAREIAPAVGAALDTFHRARIADALAAIAHDLALHAHTLAGHLKRALPPAVAADLLQGVAQMAPAEAMAVLATPPRIECFRRLAATGTADAHSAGGSLVSAVGGGGDGRGIGLVTGAVSNPPAACASAASTTAPTLRWAQLLAQQLLCTLWRLHRCGILALPAPVHLPHPIVPAQHAAPRGQSQMELAARAAEPLERGAIVGADAAAHPSRPRQPRAQLLVPTSEPRGQGGGRPRLKPQGALRTLQAFPTGGKLPFLAALIATPSHDKSTGVRTLGLTHSKTAPGYLSATPDAP